MSETDSTKRDGVIDARVAAVAARYGDVLSPEQLDGIRRRIGRTLEIEADLKQVALNNSDEPEIVFTPFRGES